MPGVEEFNSDIKVLGTVTATYIVKENSSDNYILLGGGGHTLVSNFATYTSLSANYYTKTESVNLFVGRTGVETIADTKTFSSSPVVPSPTLDNHAVNRGWVTSQGYLTSSSLSGYATQNYVVNNFVYRNGSNAIDTWNRDSQGLLINGTVEGKTFGPGGIGASLNDATYGSVAGVINTHGTTTGNPTDNWYHRIKMLHNNPGGYYTEIAVAMDSVPAMYYKQFYAGGTAGWIQLLDVREAQTVTGIKTFRTTGNNAVTDIPLQAYSDNASFPAISFHKSGAYAGSIALTPTRYEFRNQAGTGLLNAKANAFLSEAGFVHDQYDSPHVVLTSDGEGVYAGVDIINDAGELRIQPAEITSSGAIINCDNYQHKLIYIRVRSGNEIKVINASQGQRFVLFNVDGGSDSNVDINGATGTLSPYAKISCYITSLGEVIFYDKAEIFIGVAF